MKTPIKIWWRIGKDTLELIQNEDGQFYEHYLSGRKSSNPISKGSVKKIVSILGRKVYMKVSGKDSFKIDI